MGATVVVLSRAQVGVDAPLVSVEVHLSGGLPRTAIVGLPEAAVRESKDRVRGAVVDCGYEYPQRRVTVNLAPADLPKEGGRFDLPIALGILAASNQVPRTALDGHEFTGEVGLTGVLRPVTGALPTALACRDAGRTLVLPAECAPEAAMVRGATVLGAEHLLHVIRHLYGERLLAPSPPHPPCPNPAHALELGDVQGHAQAKRALVIAAAGAHNLLMVGPPGTGKTMLATRLTGVLPAMSETESLEVASVRSVCGHPFEPGRWSQRPFRAPHHSASAVALVGGGSRPRPGEISLAHRGVLFLDELPEFERRALEALREPLESGTIVVSRAALRARFPARFQLVATMNPCPCGHLGDGTGRCGCTPEEVRRYRSRISGPLLDRIDLHVEVPRVRIPASLAAPPAGPTSASARGDATRVHELQRSRYGLPAAGLDGPALAHHCALGDAGTSLLEAAVERLGLSPRARHRVQRVARTIADLAGRERIVTEDLAEALAYRCMDRPVAGFR